MSDLGYSTMKLDHYLMTFADFPLLIKINEILTNEIQS